MEARGNTQRKLSLREKPQPTLSGYAAWVFRALVAKEGKTPAEVAEWVIEDWIRRNGKLLVEEYAISRDNYQRETNAGGVLLHHPASSRTGETGGT